MKKLIPLLLLLLFNSTIIAQNFDDFDKELIERRLDRYFNLMDNQDFKTMMDYVYPKVFTVVSKEDMITAFTEVLGGMKFNFSNMEILWIENIYSNSYGLAKYSVNMEVVLVSDEFRNEQMLNTLSGYMKSQKGVSNVETDNEDYIITMDSGKYILAINEEDYPGWHFIEFDENNPQMLNLLLSEELIKEVKERISQDN